MEKIAVIDLGTNTFHLLIAELKEGKATFLLNDKVSVKLGKGGISKNFISAEAYERAIKTIVRFKETMDQYGVTKVNAIATSAIRNARNGYTFVKDVKQKTGIDISVISGGKEAELIYNGVKQALDLGKNTSIVMDIGGGSVEFIICNQEQIFWKESFEIGAQRMLDMFHRSEPIAPVEVQRLVNFLEESLLNMVDAAKEYKPVTLVGSSGTFDTLSDIDIHAKGLHLSIEEETEYTLQTDDFERIAFDIMNKNREERMAIPGMIEMRVDMIVVACILIQYVVSKIPVQKIRVSTYALKEGVLEKVLKGEFIEGDRPDFLK